MSCVACCQGESQTVAYVPGTRVDDDVSFDVQEQSGTFDDSAGAEVFGSVQKHDAQPLPEPGPGVGAEVQEESAEQQSQECKTAFEVPLTLSRGEEIGVGLDFAEGHFLRICHLFSKGPIPEYNAGSSPDRRVQIGDFIVGIKGKTGESSSSQELLKALQNSGEMRLSIRRPFEFTVAKLDKKGGPLGLDLSYHPRGTCASVRQIFPEGAVPIYNNTAPTEKQVKVGDYIVSVNGKAGSAKDMVQFFGETSIVDFVIARPSGL